MSIVDNIKRRIGVDPVAVLKEQIDAAIREGEAAGRRLVDLDREENAALLAADDAALDQIERDRVAAERRQRAAVLRLPVLQEQLRAATATDRDKRFRTKHTELQRAAAAIGELVPLMQSKFEGYLALAAELRAIDDRRASDRIPSPPVFGSGALILAPDLIERWLAAVADPLPSANAPRAPVSAAATLRPAHPRGATSGGRRVRILADVVDHAGRTRHRVGDDLYLAVTAAEELVASGKAEFATSTPPPPAPKTKAFSAPAPAAPLALPKPDANGNLTVIALTDGLTSPDGRRLAGGDLVTVPFDTGMAWLRNGAATEAPPLPAAAAPIVAEHEVAK